MKIIQDWFTGVIWIGLPLYTEKVLHQFRMYECKPVSTPTNTDINPASASLEDVCNQKEYQAVVGSLLYLSTRTRPDIVFAVGSAARFCANPSQEHWTAVKRILLFKGQSALVWYTKGMVKPNALDTQMHIGRLVSCCSHTTSWAAADRATYSASAVDRATQVCLLLLAPPKRNR